MSQPPADKIQAPTLAAHYARALTQANETLAQTQKYLDPNSPHYLPTYIERLEALRVSAEAPTDIEQKIATMRSHLQSYQQRQAEALQIMADYPAKLSALQAEHNTFSAPQDRKADYLYLLDDETRQASQTDWTAVAANPGQTLPQEQGAFVFRSDVPIALTEPQQTDALRISSHNLVVDGVQIIDERQYKDAHRDAIQLIPPALGQKVDGIYQRIADQMAGAQLNNVTIQNCVIRAPHAPLQGIFASDGLLRGIKLRNNDILTAGAHSISLAGLLDGCEISGNSLHAVEGLEPPKITLYPARIGGQMADEGVLCLLSFAPEAGQDLLSYAPIDCPNPNQLVQTDGQVSTAFIADERQWLPENLLRMGFGVLEFRYHAYLSTYSSLTLGAYQRYDPAGYQGLLAWLAARLQEWQQGRNADHPLGAMSQEQQRIAEYLLQPAWQALQAGSCAEQRLVDLEHTAIRSFAMKRIALLHGQLQPLMDLALLNVRRNATLNFLLADSQRQHLEKVGYFEAQGYCINHKRVPAGVAFSLFFAPNAHYSGVTDAQGRIGWSQLPLGTAILSVQAPAALTLTSVDLTQQAISKAAAALAAGVLADLSQRHAVLAQYLATYPAEQDVFEQRLARCLSALGVQSNTDLTNPVRQQCMQVLGLVQSRRDPYRQLATFMLSCA